MMNENHKNGKRTPKKRRKGQNNRLALILLFTTIAIIIAGSLALTPYMLNTNEKEVVFRIPQNANFQNVSDTLRKYFPEKYAEKVEHLIKSRNIDFSKRHGAYKIPAGTSTLRCMRILDTGAQMPIRLVINHFRSINNLSEAIAAKLDFTPAEFQKSAQDSTILAKYGLKPSQALSLFLEDTYEVYWTSSPREVIEKIGRNYTTFWDAHATKKAKDVGLTPAEMMIIASITDEETNKTDEKGRIGTLYINRLNNGMRLQADPTVRYATNNFSIKRVTKEHLMYDSPYNTYRIDGLPPGPIRTTSKQTLKEILDSKPSDDLYMCAKEDFSGYHNFAKTYDEHVQNALRYQHELDRRGIK